MITLVSVLGFCQALGAIVGTSTAVWGEFAYIRAMRNGHIDFAERTHLRILGHGLRFGMLLLLGASFGLVIAAYGVHEAQPAATAAYWMLIILAFVVIVSSFALSRRAISYTLGSVVAFTAWWFLMTLTLGEFPKIPFGAAVGFFVVASVVLYLIVSLARHLFIAHTHALIQRPGRP